MLRNKIVHITPIASENMAAQNYALITPARNEEAYLEALIQSVRAQTVPPRKWIIVSDGSIDATDSIVARHAETAPFLELLHIDEAEERNFSGKARAVAAGYAALRNLEFDFIGNLDADVAFKPDFYEKVLAEFARNPRLGVGGARMMVEIDGRLVAQLYQPHNTPGPIQFFRREVFEAVGGYQPLKIGGVDTAAEIMARMRGWETRLFADISARHQRRMSTATGNVFRARLRDGAKDYFLGAHPLFMLLKAAGRLGEKPRVVGAVLRLAGYLWPMLRRERRQLPPEFVRFTREEQMARIKSFFHFR
jgi:glycosyltransferase involved in cell wall biosynthesis